MRGKKKKSTKELETELEQFIVNTGRSKDDIHTGYNDSWALKWRIDNPDSRRYDDDILQMNDLNDVFLLGMAICRKQNKINAARKVSAATAAAIATPNVTNTSISTSASTLINGNKITASFESTPPPSSNPSTTSSLPSSNEMTKPELASTSTLCPTSLLFLLHTP